MSDEFYAQLARALGSKGFQSKGHDSRANVVLLKAPHGA